MTAIDLNADVGEMDAALDARILEIVSSVSVACGGHAGDDASMRRVTAAAAGRDVRIGAHPSFVDRQGFGRTRHDVPLAVLRSQLRDQILRLADNSPRLPAYVKPHGALYHAAGQEPDLATTLLEAVTEAGERLGAALSVMGQHDAHYVLRAAEFGLSTIREGFADRAYSDDGRLVPRTAPDAVLTDEAAVLRQVTQLARGTVTTVNGAVIQVSAESLCLHSDTPGAADLAVRIGRLLADEGIVVRAYP
ncbi:MAG: LamB/YcsF family protein [Actinobacteria bacterium]|jgi:UPF0271 protein|nr:LamB/YcsF family protein [Actinomycetota bacterium]MCO5298965.1 LamB/YcsF family protein [Candidatus Nanopelagicales bacterium]HPE12876.1 5-oxoprolinase subunit PxpA [Actinomycetota bacterium]HPJ18274.1 5-oxoprolinase subunit PxpA [Actinomycetota bacterium]HPQ84686.1 5-oxoprolinase subunit PxpA [Actinomycetota bacterium]